MPIFDYYHGNEADQFTFFRIPKYLFTSEDFKSIGDSAKILYGLLLDRMGLSIKNRWLDENDNVYIIFPLEEVQESLNCGHDKASKLFAELLNIGLIKRKKQGLGKPALIYVMNFIISDSKTDVKTAEKSQSELRTTRSQEFRKQAGNKTNYNKNKDNYTENQSINHDNADTYEKTGDGKTDFSQEEIMQEIKENWNALPIHYHVEPTKMKIALKSLTKIDELKQSSLAEEKAAYCVIFDSLLELATVKSIIQLNKRIISYADIVEKINDNITADEWGEPSLYDFMLSFFGEYCRIIRTYKIKNILKYMLSSLYNWLCVGVAAEDNDIQMFAI